MVNVGKLALPQVASIGKSLSLRTMVAGNAATRVPSLTHSLDKVGLIKEMSYRQVLK